MWDINQIPELKYIKALCKPLKTFFDNEIGSKLFDLYMFFVETWIWDALYPECTYLQDIELTEEDWL